MEIHGKKEQDKYWADFRGTAGRLSSEHAGNLWTSVISVYDDDEEEVEDE